MNTPLLQRIDLIQEQITQAAQRAGRNPTEVTLIAVTKTHPARIIDQALALGITNIGENRVQEAEEKMALLQTPRDQFRCHLIGHLQRNKARRAVAFADLIHSVDSLKLAQTLNRLVDEESAVGQRRLPILLQLNVSGEASKEGFQLLNGTQSADWNAFKTVVSEILELPFIDVQGLMTIAPFSEDIVGIVRPCFRALAAVREQLAQAFPQARWHQLSMGMSGDFTVAIEEGATLVRIGTAIFGNR